jgi:hypothetical protein
MRLRGACLSQWSQLAAVSHSLESALFRFVSSGNYYCGQRPPVHVTLRSEEVRKPPPPGHRYRHMCGIVGFVGKRPAQPILLNGLKRLEYRGYDSAGAAVIKDGELDIRRTVGRVGELESFVRDNPMLGATGIAHTRWATHGRPTERNAHPHRDASGRIALVHNGIIENHAAIRSFLEGEGITFLSETDTEALVQLIGYHYRSTADIEESTRLALTEAKGDLRDRGALCDRAGGVDSSRAPGSPLDRRRDGGVRGRARTRSRSCEHTSQVDVPRAMASCWCSRRRASTRSTDARPASPRRAQADRHRCRSRWNEIEQGRLPALHAQGDPRAA